MKILIACPPNPLKKCQQENKNILLSQNLEIHNHLGLFSLLQYALLNSWDCIYFIFGTRNNNMLLITLSFENCYLDSQTHLQNRFYKVSNWVSSGCACLQSQYSGSWGRRFTSSRAIWVTLRVSVLNISTPKQITRSDIITTLPSLIG